MRVFGSITIYEARGSFQLVAKRLEGEGREGLWRAAFDRLRARLESEGLLDPARKRPLPPFPCRVAVVTSPSGAAVRDVQAVVARRAPWVTLLVSPTSVQGEGAAEEIARALERAAACSPDLILVCRGGGGAEDLWAFNQEPVARAVAASPVPVLTGIGHEGDTTIADLVADRAAATPSAAAELAAPELASVLARLEAARSGLEEALKGSVRRRRLLFRERTLDLERSGRRLVERPRADLRRARVHLERGAADAVRRPRAGLADSAARLDALSPLATLARGYSVARSAEGRLLATRAQLAPGTRFSLTVSDGDVPCEALEAP